MNLVEIPMRFAVQQKSELSLCHNNEDSATKPHTLEETIDDFNAEAFVEAVLS
jgi:hypothetical protein